MHQREIHAELGRVRDDFDELLDSATVAALRLPTNGTKWTNQQLLFHMLFGYLLVRNLRFLVRAFSRLPDSVSKRFAAALNAGTRPFHVINYRGSLGGARVLGYPRIQRLMDRTITTLQASLLRESETALDRGMHFPVGWDPYFTDYMTLRDLYHYPTQHYQHHRRQLTVAKTPERVSRSDPCAPTPRRSVAAISEGICARRVSVAAARELSSPRVAPSQDASRINDRPARRPAPRAVRGSGA